MKARGYSTDEHGQTDTNYMWNALIDAIDVWERAKRMDRDERWIAQKRGIIRGIAIGLTCRVDGLSARAAEEQGMRLWRER